MALITDIAEAVKGGASNEALDAIIAAYIAEYDHGYTVREWRIANYIQLRRWAYPPIEDYADAQVKNAMGGSLALEGKAQADTYAQACYAVKLRFPKL